MFRQAGLVFVGASLLAMVVNDYACLLAERGALESIASRARSYKKCADNGFIERRLRATLTGVQSLLMTGWSTGSMMNFISWF